MGQKLYFLATDKADNSDLWVTDGTTTEAVGGISDLGVSGSATGGLGPSSLTVFGQQMIFAGADALNTGGNNGIWLTDGTPGNTTEIGGVSPGTGHSSPFNFGNPNGLNPNGFVSFGTKAIFFGTDAANFTGLWATDGSPGGTEELGGLENGQIVGASATLSPENLTAFDNSVLFDGNDSTEFQGLWITDGTTAGTVEIGGPKNEAIFDSGLTSFNANDFITLGSLALFNAPNREGDAALWVTDGTANGTVEIGGVSNDGIAGSHNTSLGDGLAQAVRFGDRIFFSGDDNDGADGLWTTDGTATGTTEIGGLANAGVGPGQHPSSLGLSPTDLTVNGQQVLFDGLDALGFQELWASDGTASGTYEIGGEGIGGPLTGEASNGVNPSSIVSLGNGKAVFIGDDDSNNQASGKPTLWVTDGTFGDTEEIGGSDNQGVGGINSGGFSITNLIGGDGLAYFIGVDASGNQVLWETDGTMGGTKIVNATDGNAPATGISPANMALGPVPASQADFTGGGETINLEQVPGEEVNLSDTDNVLDTVTGSNGTLNLTAAQAALIGGGLLVNFVAGAGEAVNLSNTKGNKDSVYGSKGTVTLNGAQASVYGPD
jgi:ELWxxDGT repeat protein